MGSIIIKLVDRAEMIINGDAITYAEGGNVLEILNEDEEILAAFRNWEYAMVQESEAEYQRSVAADLDEDEDLEDDDEYDDEELDDDEEGDDEGDGGEELSPAEEEAVQRAREVMQRVIAEHNGQAPVVTLEDPAHSESQS